MDITIKITEAFADQQGVNVNYSTAAWPEGRTVFVVLPLDANGIPLSGEDLMSHLETVAPMGELEVRDTVKAVENVAAIEALVGIEETRVVQTQSERKVASVLAASASMKV